MVYYNLTLISANSTSTIDMIRIVNSELLNNLFGVLLLLVAFAIVLLSTLSSTENAQKSFFAAAFVSMIVSYMLLILGLVSIYAALITTSILIVSAVINIKSS